MVVVNESHKLISVAVGSNVPGLLGFLEVETYYRTVVFACNGIAFTVAVHKVASVLAVNHAAALGHGIASAPEFNGIEHENIGERGNLIYGKAKNTSSFTNLFPTCWFQLRSLLVSEKLPMQEVETNERERVAATATVRYFFFIVLCQWVSEY